MNIPSHMNDLKTKLKGLNQLIKELYQYRNRFQRRLKLLEKQIIEKNFAHLPRLNGNQPTDYSIYINFIQDLRQQFEIRFTSIHSKKQILNCFLSHLI